MADQRCLDNIKKKEPPIYCEDKVKDFCMEIMKEITETCTHLGYGGDVPMIQRLPDKSKCWCCCSCFAYNTPIEVAPGQFKMIQDIKADETVLAAGPSLEWLPRKVSTLGGMGPSVKMDFMWYMVARFDDSVDGTRHLITTADHLFLMPDGRLQPIQDLRPGDQIRRADGEIATIVFAVPGQYSGGVRHIAMGNYNPGESLDGHLLNSNGMVTADLSVQTAFYSGRVENHLLATELSERPAPATPAFFAQYGAMELHAFMADKKQWPPLFVPHRQSLMNIPPNAVSFFTQEQAEDIQATITQADYGNNDVLATVKYLFKIFQAFQPGVLFVLDWPNDLPNAYYFADFNQQYIVLNGGLARSEVMARDGLSIVLSHLLAACNGHPCVGPADYYGVMLYLRQVWSEELYLQVFESGVTQVEALFAAISPDHAGENPDDLCAQPSIACRMDTINAAVSMKKLPVCAIPAPALALQTVKVARNLGSLTLQFNQLLNPPSAQTCENYKITVLLSPATVQEIIVLEARITGDKYDQVVLKVEGLEVQTTYEIEVKDVLSLNGHLISSVGNKKSFETP